MAFQGLGITELNHSFQFHGQTLAIIFILFFFILLVISLCIYFHFISPNNSHFSANMTAAANSSSQLPIIVQSLGLDAAAINSLPIIIHSSLATPKMQGSSSTCVDQENECSICLGLFHDEEMVKVLPICHHIYHSVCVDKWLSTRSNCPLCRASLRVDSPSAEPIAP